MAEIELSVLARQSRKERTESTENLEHHIKAWESRRNQSAAKVNWQFTTKDAKVKLKKRYPVAVAG